MQYITAKAHMFMLGIYLQLHIQVEPVYIPVPYCFDLNLWPYYLFPYFASLFTHSLLRSICICWHRHIPLTLSCSFFISAIYSFHFSIFSKSPLSLPQFRFAFDPSAFFGSSPLSIFSHPHSFPPCSWKVYALDRGGTSRVLLMEETAGH